MNARMQRDLLAVLFLALVVPVSANAQEEGALAVMESYLANCDAFENYDVSYNQWIGLYPSDSAPDQSWDVDEVKVKGRVIIDWMEERVFHIEEQTIIGDKKRSVLSRISYWSENAGHAYMQKQEVLSRANNFQSFLKEQVIPAVQVTLAKFPGTFDGGSREDITRARRMSFSKGVLRRGQDQTMKVVVAGNGVRCLLEIDPISSMPFHFRRDSHDPKTDEFLRTVDNCQLRYSKTKEIYCLIALDHDGLFPLSGQVVPSVSTCTFDWLQLNEENFDFPITKEKPFEMNTALELLASQTGEGK